VSERTIYRDLDALSAAGVPVCAEGGPRGGCFLTEDYRTDLTGLTRIEAQSLLMAALPGALSDLGLGSAFQAGLLKLLAALPAGGRRAAERARDRVYLDATWWFRHPEPPPHLHLLHAAVWGDRRLVLIYNRPGGETHERVVEPYGLVAKAGVWYLAAATTDGMRVFRAARIVSVSVLDEGFVRSADFDLAAFWAAWLAEFETGRPHYPVTLRISVDALPTLASAAGEAVSSLRARIRERNENGWVTVPVDFESEDEARDQLLRLGTAVQVTDPPALRDRLAARAAQIAAWHADGGSNPLWACWTS